MTDSNYNDKEKKKQDVILVNVKSTILYALSVAVALGFNELVTSIFASFPNTQHIITKTTYVMFMFGVSILAAYWLSTSFNT